MATFYVYEHWRTDRQECFYVGKGKAGRAYKMRGRNRFHQAICAKLSRDGHAVEVKIVESGLEEARAFTLEMQRIRFWRSVGADLANATAGGEGLSNPSLEVRKKIGVSKLGNKNMVGRKLSEETRQKISASNKGKRAPEGAIERLRQINLGNKYNLGNRPSEETRAKMALAHKGHRHNVGRIPTAATRAKMSAAHSGKKMSAAAVEKTVAVHRKPVLCVTDGRTFRSAMEAGNYYGLFNHAKVAEVCRGVRASAAKRVFKYLEKETS